MLPVTITNDEKIPITLGPRTITGKPAAVDGAPIWTVIDGKCTLEPAVDGLSCFIVSADGDNGVSHVEVKADADLGGGVATISDIIEVTVTSAQAALLGLAAGAAVPKTQVATPEVPQANTPRSATTRR